MTALRRAAPVWFLVSAIAISLLTAAWCSPSVFYSVSGGEGNLFMQTETGTLAWSVHTRVADPASSTSPPVSWGEGLLEPPPSMSFDKIAKGSGSRTLVVSRLYLTTRNLRC